MTAELIDVIDGASLSDLPLEVTERIQLLVFMAPGGESPEQLRAAVASALSGLERLTGETVVSPGSGKTSALLRALRNALAHDAQLRHLAAHSSVDPDTLLEVLRTELTRGPKAAPQFVMSELERQTLGAASVSLSGPSRETVDPTLLTIARFTRLLGDALTVQDAASRLHVSSGRVRQRLNERTLYGVQTRQRGSWRLPDWQFTDEGAVPGIELVLPRLPPRAHPLAVSNFLTRPDPDLEVGDSAVSPLEWLLSGGDASVVADLASQLPSAP